MAMIVQNMSPKRINIAQLMIIALVGQCHASLNYSCGGYIKAAVGDSGVISSPDYPDEYPNHAHCIWLLVAPKEYAIQLDLLTGVQGEMKDGKCNDYLEIRNGSSSQTLIYYECDTTETQTMISSSRWLWVRFRSDDTVVNAGFSSNYTVVSSPGNSADSSPEPECPGANFKCPNKECVYMSYRCDSWNDCGCTDGCDEQNCGGLVGWANWEKVVLGIGVGAAVFLVVFVGIGLLDICLKKRTASKYKQRVEKQKRIEKQRKAKAIADNFAKSTGASKMSLDVPSINLSASLNSTKSMRSDSLKPSAS